MQASADQLVGPQLYIGLMSGTSLDGIDAILARIGPDAFEVIDSFSCAFAPNMRKALLELCHAESANLSELGAINRQYGDLLGHTVNQLLKQAAISPSNVHAIGSHGQTIRHRPTHPYPFSMQLGDASTLAERTNITTIADFRMADIASGGEGAPLVPAFHNAIFRSHCTDRAIINIGGISNITLLPHDPASEVIGYDIGPGNTLMDQWASKNIGAQYDEEGKWARQGTVDAALLELALNDSYFAIKGPKSTGREHFHLEWLTNLLSQLDKPLTPCNVQATLAELTAVSIASAIKNSCEQKNNKKTEAYVCGGGVHNRHLLERLNHHLPNIDISTTNALGVDPQLVEASAFAWLAYRTSNHLTGNLPSVTGATRGKILGGTYHP